MDNFRYTAVRWVLFKFGAEQSHHLVFTLLKIFDKYRFLRNLCLRGTKVDTTRIGQTIRNLKFSNPIGLAAGFDKDAQAVNSLINLGFGFIEVGTVTLKPQPGNPRPRLFRHPRYESLQNAMGFNNKGLKAMQNQLKKRYPASVPIGVNVGKNKETPNDKCLDEYAALFEGLKDYCDYFVINISSPNTPGLRELANEKFVTDIFRIGIEATSKPIFLKLSPDSDINSLIKLTHVAVEAGAVGIIANNTSTNYSLCPGAKQFGGLSGQAIRDQSLRVLRAISHEMFRKTTIISVGGIDDAYEAYRRIKAGASLVQIYTGLVYKGPGLIKTINQELNELLRRDGFKCLSDAVGADLAN